MTVRSMLAGLTLAAVLTASAQAQTSDEQQVRAVVTAYRDAIEQMLTGATWHVPAAQGRCADVADHPLAGCRHGLITGTPVGSTSAVFRVTNVRP